MKLAYERYLDVARELVRLRNQQSAMIDSYFQVERSLFALIDQRVAALSAVG